MAFILRYLFIVGRVKLIGLVLGLTRVRGRLKLLLRFVLGLGLGTEMSLTGPTTDLGG